MYEMLLMDSRVNVRNYTRWNSAIKTAQMCVIY